MTVMDKISGWEDEEKWVGSKFAACMWIYTKWANTQSNNGGTFEATFDVHHVVQELSTTTSGYPKAQFPSKKKK